MKGTRASARYAQSLLSLALETGELEKVFADVKLILHTIHENRDLAAMLKSPVIKTDKKKVILDAVFSKEISNVTNKFLQLIATHKREEYLELIGEEFIQKYKKHKNILTAVITTASGLDDEMRKKIYELVKKQMNSEVELIEKVNKDLIGGFILRVGDKQNDTSILGKIRLLERTFKENRLN
ncbi:MAG TPA: ATP synthase F1 subunit delta [Bacteroidia bacterium]|jgi:F-type H+-transporting ATPase subunit delta|nr:ATP synthase F1 subunit delta [Bacteroidia bacterium]